METLYKRIMTREGYAYEPVEPGDTTVIQKEILIMLAQSLQTANEVANEVNIAVLPEQDIAKLIKQGQATKQIIEAFKVRYPRMYRMILVHILPMLDEGHFCTEDAIKIMQFKKLLYDEKKESIGPASEHAL